MSSQWFCDKFATNLNAYVEPQRLDTRDIVVGAFTGEQLFYTRAVASAATWMSHFAHAHIYAASASQTIPVIGLAAKYPHLRTDVVTSLDVQPIQMLALRDMYLRHPHAKWYYIVGDDLFAIADHMPAHASSSTTASQPHW